MLTNLVSVFACCLTCSAVIPNVIRGGNHVLYWKR